MTNGEKEIKRWRESGEREASREREGERRGEGREKRRGGEGERERERERGRETNVCITLHVNVHGPYCFTLVTFKASKYLYHIKGTT